MLAFATGEAVRALPLRVTLGLFRRSSEACSLLGRIGKMDFYLLFCMNAQERREPVVVLFHQSHGKISGIREPVGSISFVSIVDENEMIGLPFLPIESHCMRRNGKIYPARILDEIILEWVLPVLVGSLIPQIRVILHTRRASALEIAS